MSELYYTKEEVELIRDAHDPEQQVDTYPGRCNQCSFIRSPCEPLALARDWLSMDERWWGVKNDY